MAGRLPGHHSPSLAAAHDRAQGPTLVGECAAEADAASRARLRRRGCRLCDLWPLAARAFTVPRRDLRALRPPDLSRLRAWREAVRRRTYAAFRTEAQRPGGLGACGQRLGLRILSAPRRQASGRGG